LLEEGEVEILQSEIEDLEVLPLGREGIPKVEGLEVWRRYSP